MAKQFIDFFFCGKKLSSVSPDYISVDFEAKDERGMKIYEAK